MAFDFEEAMNKRKAAKEEKLKMNFDIFLHLDVDRGSPFSTFEEKGVKADSPQEAIDLVISKLSPEMQRFVLRDRSRARNCDTGKVYPDR